MTVVCKKDNGDIVWTLPGIRSRLRQQKKVRLTSQQRSGVLKRVLINCKLDAPYTKHRAFTCIEREFIEGSSSFERVRRKRQNMTSALTERDQLNIRQMIRTSEASASHPEAHRWL